MKMLAPMEVGIAVRDLPRMVEFYRQVLGCNLVSQVAVPADKAAANAMAPEGCTVVRLQTAYGERIKLLAPATPPPADAPAPWLLSQPGICYLTFITDGLERHVEALRAAGVTMMSENPPVENRPGIRVVFFRDPEGNALELVEYADIAAYRPDLRSPS